MESVVVDSFALLKLQDLYAALLDKGYFLEEVNAKKYIDRLLDFIYKIPTKSHRLTKNRRWGSYYATYKPNRHTTWYITFDVEKEQYLVLNIFNNHTPDYPRFIGKIK